MVIMLAYANGLYAAKRLEMLIVILPDLAEYYKSIISRIICPIVILFYSRTFGIYPGNTPKVRCVFMKSFVSSLIKNYIFL